MDDRLLAIYALIVIQYRDGSPRTGMACAHGADDKLCAGDLAGLQRSCRGVGVVTIEHRVLGAVGIDCPETLGIGKIAVHVFPAVINEAAVGHDRGMAFCKRADSDLIDPATVRVHCVEIVHDVLVAHAIFLLASR